MNEPRQRTACPLVTGLVVLSALAISSGCDAAASVGGAQTAVTVAQTAVGRAQTVLPAVQTSLPGLQATAQAGATQVAAVVSDPQAVNAQLQVLLAGATVVVNPTPAGAKGGAVTRLDISGSDTRGTLGSMDPSARQAAAGAALLLMGQYYPNAAISLTLVDSKGGPLLSGTKAPGEGPSFQ
ncbi:MAG: hypothetical protein M3069_23150 [Chloroflexota bacterium]|nr:hypothetical protein [Chloroflexota bacterium]